jgi:predicted PurR-regulated permease PerM
MNTNVLVLVVMLISILSILLSTIVLVKIKELNEWIAVLINIQSASVDDFEKTINFEIDNINKKITAMENQLEQIKKGA